MPSLIMGHCVGYSIKKCLCYDGPGFKHSHYDKCIITQVLLLEIVYFLNIAPSNTICFRVVLNLNCIPWYTEVCSTVDLLILILMALC